MRALWISICVILIIAFVEAQRNINVPKPIVSLEKRPRLPTWRRLPEERRKLSIFPKNITKFVVTERTTKKNELTTPVMTTKRPLMRKLFFQDKNERYTFTYPARKPLMEPKRFNVSTTLTTKRNNAINYKTETDETAEESSIKTIVTSVRTESSVNNFKLNKGNLIQVLDSINKADVTPVKITEQTKKDSSKPVTKVIQSNDSLKIISPDKISEGYVTEKSVDNKIESITVSKIEEQIDKTTEKVFFSKQVDNVVQNNVSSNANTHDEGPEEYEYDENYYDNSEENVTATNINEQVGKSTEKVFLTKQLNNVIQNNNSLKLNIPETVFVDHGVIKSDLDSVTTPAQIIKENESTAHVFIEEPISFSEPFEGRSLNSTNLELNDQSNHRFMDLIEKTGDSTKLENLELLMKEIVKDTWSDSYHKTSSSSNDFKPLPVSTQNITEETVKDLPQILNEKPDSHLVVKPVLNMADESKFSNGIHDDAAVTKVTEKEEIGNTETKTEYTNSEINKNNIPIDVMNNLEDLIEVITNKSTLADMKEFNENSQQLKLDVVDENTEGSDAILSVYDGTTPGSISYDNVTESPIEVTYDNLKMSKAEKIKIISVNDSEPKVLEIIEHGDTNNAYSEIDNSNIQQNVNDEKSAIIDYLQNLAEGIKNKFTDSDDSEVSVENKPVVNLDMNIVEEYSDKPGINTTEAEGSIQDSYITASPIEIILDSQEALITEKLPFEPSFNENLDNITDNPVFDQLNVTDEVISTTDDPVTEHSLKVEDENINITFPIENLIIEKNTNENKANSAIQNGFPKSGEAVNDSNDHDKSEAASAGTQILNEDVNIGEDDSSWPDTVTSVVDEPFGTNESNIEVKYVLDTPIGMLFNDYDSDSTDTTLNNNKIDTSDSVSDTEVAIDETELLNHYMNVTKDDSNNPDTITILVDTTYDTQEAYDKDVTDAPITILFNDFEPPGTNESEMEQLNLTEKIISKGDPLVTELPQIVENGNINIDNMTAEKKSDDNSLRFTGIINNESHAADNNVVSTSGPQLATLHTNIAEENSEEPKTITMVFDGTTQKTYLNDEHVDDGPIGILFHNLEPLGPNKLLPSRYLNEGTNKSMSEQSISSDGVISYEATTHKSAFSEEDISDEWLVNSSSPPDEMTSNEPIILNSNNYNGEGVSNKLNKTDEDISSESIVENSINLSDEISNESSVIDRSSTVTKEEMSEEMIAEADQSNNLTRNISNESHVLYETSNSVITNDEISDEEMAVKFGNLTDESTNESLMVNDCFSSAVTNEKRSDENINSENITDEITDESFIIVNESSSSSVTNEEVSDERTADKSENMSDEISDESHIRNESSSSLVTDEKIFNEIIIVDSETLTDGISNKSPVLTMTETATTDLTGDGAFDEVTYEPNTVTVEDESTEPAIDIRHPSTELASNGKLVNRRKRSNNVIEEENLATTLSGFKYSGHDTRLGQDLSFKNINV